MCYKKIGILLLVTMFSTAISTPSIANEEVVNSQITHEMTKSIQAEYRLSKYDVINLAIPGLDEKDTKDFKDIIIGMDGYVNLPYAGSVRLAGLTVPEATNVLKEKMGEYLKIHDMAVMLSKYGKQKVYVMGEVGKQGIYDLDTGYMNVFAAISSAGGITKRGRPKHIAVVRMVDGKVQMQEVNFDRFVEKQDASQNALLQDGDMVYVPRSNRIDLYEDIMPLVNTYAVFKSLTN